MFALMSRTSSTLFVGVLALVLCAAAPLEAATAYDEMSDAQLTEVLQGWGALDSADRRSLLVELRKRMQRAEQSNRTLATATANTAGSPMPASGSQIQGQNQSHKLPRQARVTIHIRVRQNMRFGAGIDANGVLLVRSGALGAGDPNSATSLAPQAATNAMRQMLTLMRARMARAEPLPGPGFGDGFERRQDYLKASLSGDQNPSQNPR